MIPTLVLLGMLVLLALGTPVGFALLIAGTAGLLAHGGLGMALGILKTSSVSAAGSYELISIPMFMLMAEFVILSGVADSLFRAASTWVGRLPGSRLPCHNPSTSPKMTVRSPSSTARR